MDVLDHYSAWMRGLKPLMNYTIIYLKPIEILSNQYAISKTLEVYNIHAFMLKKSKNIFVYASSELVY